MNAMGTAQIQANGTAGLQASLQGLTGSGTTLSGAGLFQMLLSGQLGQQDAKQAGMQDLLDLLSGLNADQLLELLSALGMLQPQNGQVNLSMPDVPMPISASNVMQVQTAGQPVGKTPRFNMQVSQAALKQQIADQIAAWLEQAGVSLKEAVKQLNQAVTNEKMPVKDALTGLLLATETGADPREMPLLGQIAKELNLQRVEWKTAPKKESPAPLQPAQIHPEISTQDESRLTGKNGWTSSVQRTADSAKPIAVSGPTSADIRTESPHSADFPAMTNPLSGLTGTRGQISEQTLPSQPVHLQMGTDQFKFEFPASVVKQANLLERGGANEMRITLMPEGLGEVQIRIQGENGQVSLLISADTSHARSLLDGSIGMLRHQLEAQGVQVNRVEVAPTVSSDSMSMNQGMLSGHNRQRQDSHSQQSRNPQLRNEMLPVEDSEFYSMITETSIGQIDYTA